MNTKDELNNAIRDRLNTLIPNRLNIAPGCELFCFDNSGAIEKKILVTGTEKRCKQTCSKCTVSCEVTYPRMEKPMLFRELLSFSELGDCQSLGKPPELREVLLAMGNRYAISAEGMWLRYDPIYFWRAPIRMPHYDLTVPIQDQSIETLTSILELLTN